MSKKARVLKLFDTHVEDMGCSCKECTEIEQPQANMLVALHPNTIAVAGSLLHVGCRDTLPNNKNVLFDHISHIVLCKDGNVLVYEGRLGIVRIIDIKGNVKTIELRIPDGSMVIPSDYSCMAVAGDDPKGLFLLDFEEKQIYQLDGENFVQVEQIIVSGERMLWNDTPTNMWRDVSVTPFGEYLLGGPHGIFIVKNNKLTMLYDQYVTQCRMDWNKKLWAICGPTTSGPVCLISNNTIIKQIHSFTVYLGNIAISNEGVIYGICGTTIVRILEDGGHTEITDEKDSYRPTPMSHLAVDATGIYYSIGGQVRKYMLPENWSLEVHRRLFPEDKYTIKVMTMLWQRKNCIVHSLPKDIFMFVLTMCTFRFR